MLDTQAEALACWGLFRPSPLGGPRLGPDEPMTDLSAAAVLRRAEPSARFRLARKLAGLTLAVVSAEVRVSTSMLCRYERRPEMMSALAVARYATAVGVSVALLTGKPESGAEG